MAAFSSKSKAKLDTCDKKLQKVFNEVIKHWDCTILEGHRDQKTQDMYYEQGKSKLKWPSGKHNSIPSKAVDVAPYFKNAPNIRWNDVDSFRYFAGFVMGIAASMNIKLRWGGDWDGDKDNKDQSFHDLPHFELVD